MLGTNSMNLQVLPFAVRDIYTLPQIPCYCARNSSCRVRPRYVPDHLRIIECPDSHLLIGGVVYPIMLRRLFLVCGFEWGIRISGFICLALCSVACCTVTSRLHRIESTAPWFQMKHFRDLKFMLLVIGSAFVSLGTFTCT